MSEGDVSAGEPRNAGKKRRGAGCLRWLGGVILLLGLAAIGAIYQAIASARDAKAYKPFDKSQLVIDAIRELFEQVVK